MASLTFWMSVYILSVLQERNKMYRYTKMSNVPKSNTYAKHTQCVMHNEQSNGLSEMSEMSLFVLSHLFRKVLNESTMPVSSTM